MLPDDVADALLLPLYPIARSVRLFSQLLMPLSMTLHE
jgi:hypothetical protein